jgi:hypothetical protein
VKYNEIETWSKKETWKKIEKSESEFTAEKSNWDVWCESSKDDHLVHCSICVKKKKKKKAICESELSFVSDMKYIVN